MALVNVSARYIGARYTNFVNTERLGGYTLFNGYAEIGEGFRIGAVEQVKLRVNVDNILDRDYLGTIGTGTTGVGSLTRASPLPRWSARTCRQLLNPMPPLDYLVVDPAIACMNHYGQSGAGRHVRAFRTEFDFCNVGRRKSHGLYDSPLIAQAASALATELLQSGEARESGRLQVMKSNVRRNDGVQRVVRRNQCLGILDVVHGHVRMRAARLKNLHDFRYQLESRDQRRVVALCGTRAIDGAAGQRHGSLHAAAPPVLDHLEEIDPDSIDGAIRDLHRTDEYVLVHPVVSPGRRQELRGTSRGRRRQCGRRAGRDPCETTVVDLNYHVIIGLDGVFCLQDQNAVGTHGLPVCPTWQHRAFDARTVYDAIYNRVHAQFPCVGRADRDGYTQVAEE